MVGPALPVLEAKEIAPRRLLARTVRLRRWVGGRLERTSPLLKQLPIAVLYGLAVALCVVLPEVPITNSRMLLLGVITVLLATALAFGFTLGGAPDGFGNLVAALDFAAIFALLCSTGGHGSIFGILAVLPALWIASDAGRRYIAYTLLGVGLVFLAPLAIQGSLVAGSTGFVLAAFNVLAYAVAATIINELARQARMHLQRVLEHEQAVEQEIERGREVQQALLPQPGSPLPGYQVAGTCLPARMVGGDFYDWYPVPEGFAFTLADVMGKGVGAGMIAATTRSVIRSAGADPDPAIALIRADAALATEFRGLASFATAFHGRIDEGGLLRYADAGHGLTLHIHADGTWERLAAIGIPLGTGFPDLWKSRELLLSPGDMLLSCSDGVLDFYDGTLSAVDHLALIATGADSLDEVISAIAELTAKAHATDDVTVLAIRRSTS